MESAGPPEPALHLCLTPLSFQKPARKEEEEALPVANQAQGRVPVGVPEQAGRTPALGQHLSHGESRLQPGALQVSLPAKAPLPAPRLHLRSYSGIRRQRVDTGVLGTQPGLGSPDQKQRPPPSHGQRQAEWPGPSGIVRRPPSLHRCQRGSPSFHQRDSSSHALTRWGGRGPQLGGRHWESVHS